jgi:hypothetical protein
LFVRFAGGLSTLASPPARSFAEVETAARCTSPPFLFPAGGLMSGGVAAGRGVQGVRCPGVQAAQGHPERDADGAELEGDMIRSLRSMPDVHERGPGAAPRADPHIHRDIRTARDPRLRNVFFVTPKGLPWVFGFTLGSATLILFDFLSGPLRIA